MKINKALFLFTTFLTMTALLPGCAGKTGLPGKQAYINAKLLFSISYPESWASSLTEPDMSLYPENSISWNIRKENLHNGYLTLTIISLPKNGVLAGTEMMVSVLNDIHINFTLSSSEMAQLPAGPAIVINGYTPHQTFRAWAIDGDRNHYLLICASSPELFVEQVPLFEEIAQSFQIL